jgi:hypothetical protein
VALSADYVARRVGLKGIELSIPNTGVGNRGKRQSFRANRREEPRITVEYDDFSDNNALGASARLESVLMYTSIGGKCRTNRVFQRLRLRCHFGSALRGAAILSAIGATRLERR